MIGKLLKFILGERVGGRLFLTVVSGFCFAYMVVTEKPDKDAMLLIGMVFALYFTRNDRNIPKQGEEK